MIALYPYPANKIQIKDRITRPVFSFQPGVAIIFAEIWGSRETAGVSSRGFAKSFILSLANGEVCRSSPICNPGRLVPEKEHSDFWVKDKIPLDRNYPNLNHKYCPKVFLQNIKPG
ncbi:MAG: hypothetical protein R6T89_02335 [Candidatus Syntrophosphaera sp.]